MTQKMVVLYENFADSAVLAGGSWQLPLTNLQDPDIQRVARSTNATTAATKITIDLGRVRQVGGVAWGPANNSPGSSWRFRGFMDAAYSVLAYDSGVVLVTGAVVDWTNPALWLEWEDPGFWLGVSDFATFEELPQYNYHIIPASGLSAALTARYWLLEIFDSANQDNFVESGRLLIGRALRPATNYSQDNDYSVDPVIDVEESLGGLRSYFERGLRRRSRFTFPNLTQTEVFDDMTRLMLRSSISRQVFIVPDPDDLTFGKRRSFLATFRQVPTIQQLLVDRGATALDFEEVL